MLVVHVIACCGNALSDWRFVTGGLCSVHTGPSCPGRLQQLKKKKHDKSEKQPGEVLIA